MNEENKFLSRAKSLINSVYRTEPPDEPQALSLYLEAADIQAEYMEKSNSILGVKKTSLGDYSEEFFGSSQNISLIAPEAKAILDSIFPNAHFTEVIF